MFTLNMAEPVFGINMVLRGQFRKGFQWVEECIRRRDAEGALAVGVFSRLNLAELYIEILTSKEAPPLAIVFRNITTVLSVKMTGQRRAMELLERLVDNKQLNSQVFQLNSQGFLVGRIQMNLGLVHKFGKRNELARKYLEEAKRIVSQSGPSPLLTKIETALAEVA